VFRHGSAEVGISVDDLMALAVPHLDPSLERQPTAH